VAVEDVLAPAEPPSVVEVLPARSDTVVHAATAASERSRRT
jgi:hypothetical protein